MSHLPELLQALDAVATALEADDPVAAEAAGEQAVALCLQLEERRATLAPTGRVRALLLHARCGAAVEKVQVRLTREIALAARSRRANDAYRDE